MHHRTLRELSKFLSGVVAADMASIIVLGSAGFFPLTMLGVTWTTSAIVPAVIFDGALLLLLIHYGWSMKLPLQSPSERTLLLVASLIFFVVALVHLTRLMFGLHLALGSFEVPLWLSWLGFFVTGYLSYSSLHFALRTKGKK
jgi:hypothetical protein